MTDNINKEPITVLPKAEGFCLGKVVKHIDTRKAGKEDNQFDVFDIEIILSNRIGNVIIADDCRRVQASINGGAGKYVSNLAGKEVQLFEVFKKGNYWNIRHVMSLKDFKEQIDELEAAK